MNAPAACPPPGCTVLVVDDEPMFVRLAQRVLRSLGCRILSAASGDEALALLEERPVDLLLVDVLMPQTSGPQVVERVHERYPGLPVLFMSGHRRDTCLAHGLPPDAPFIAKPFGAQELRERVDALLPAISAAARAGP